VAHPADALPPSNVALVQLAGTHPEPAPLRAALRTLGLEQAIAITWDRDVRLATLLRTPRGLVTL
jgi:hypothetical protein